MLETLGGTYRRALAGHRHPPVSVNLRPLAGITNHEMRRLKTANTDKGGAWPEDETKRQVIVQCRHIGLVRHFRPGHQRLDFRAEDERIRPIGVIKRLLAKTVAGEHQTLLA